jgi:3-hydroxybutyryl-CoA dehydrogenase
MKIAVLAHKEIKEEFLSKNIPPAVDLIMTDSLSSLLLVEKADAYFDLEFEMDDQRIRSLSSLLPSLVLVNSVIYTLEDIDRPFVRINAWPTFLRRNICEIATGEDQKEIAIRLFNDLRWPYQLVKDTPGMVSARIISMIINEGFYTFEEKVSSKNEIDIAMQLGTNYPYGPFEWSGRIGLKNIYQLLSRLHNTDNSYTIAKSLEREIIR